MNELLSTTLPALLVALIIPGGQPVVKISHQALIWLSCAALL